MSLINIEYGSLASSEVMNNNFSFLEDKITTSASELSTNISSILSNIATINNRLIEITDALSDATDSFNSKVDELKTKFNISINKLSLIPDWSNVFVVNSLQDYKVSGNGYLFVTSVDEAGINITINGMSFENIGNPLCLIMPVNDGDVINSVSLFDKAYFLPVMRFSLEG